MHIAIIADNIADRKQAERLLDRADTTLSKSIGTLFVDSYGDQTSFLHACMKYDLFLLDFDENPALAIETAQALKERCAPGIIAICKKADAPFQYEPAIQGMFTLDKPILTAPLHKLLTDVQLLIDKKKSETELIEIRNETGTRYISKDKIIYAQCNEEEHKIHYCFTDGEFMDCVGTVEDMLRCLGDHAEFKLKTKTLLVNTDHITAETKKSIRLSNGESFEYSFLQRLALTLSR